MLAALWRALNALLVLLGLRRPVMVRLPRTVRLTLR